MFPGQSKYYKEHNFVSFPLNQCLTESIDKSEKVTQTKATYSHLPFIICEYSKMCEYYICSLFVTIKLIDLFHKSQLPGNRNLMILLLKETKVFRCPEERWKNHKLQWLLCT